MYVHTYVCVHTYIRISYTCKYTYVYLQSFHIACLPSNVLHTFVLNRTVCNATGNYIYLHSWRVGIDKM